MGLGKRIMTCLHHYNIIHNIFTVLKILCALPIQPPPNSDLSIVSIVLPFPERHIVVKQYVGFSDWLLLLSTMQLSFLYVFSWLNSSFLLSAE